MGAFAIYPFTEAGRVVGARLAEFVVGSAKLREAHEVWISQYLAPNLRKYPGAWIDLHGHASLTGTPGSNYALSNTRIASVRNTSRSFIPLYGSTSETRMVSKAPLRTMLLRTRKMVTTAPSWCAGSGCH